MNAYGRVTDALNARGCRGRGTSWQCPAHEDRSPSLSVGKRNDGNGVVLTCHTGCDTEDVVAALGLTMADLFDEPLPKPDPHQQRRKAAEYPYTDEYGEVLFRVERWEPGKNGKTKDFIQRAADGGYKTKGIRRVLYRLPEVVATAQAGGVVIVCEGEKDVENLAATGACATTMPGGVGMGWRDDYTASLRGAAEVVVIADRDQPGIAHARKVAASLARFDVPHRIMLPAVDRPKGDVSDHLAAGYGFEDLIPLAEAEQDDAEQAPQEPEEEPPTDRATSPTPSWRPRDLTEILNGTYQAPQPTVGRRDDGVGLFYPGRVHSVVGESEGGKTWFALLAVACELQAGNSVVFIDFEDDAPGAVGRLLTLGAEPKAISERFAYIRPEDPLNLEWNKLELGQALHDLRPTLVPIDGVTEGMAMHGMELKDNTDVAKFGRMLLRPIAELGAAVSTLDHVTKDKEGRGRYAIGGVHKLNGLNGAMYVLENRTPFGVGVTGKSTVRIAKDRPGQLRRHALPSSGGMHWFADFTLQSHDETFAEASLAAPIERTGPFRPTGLMKKVSDALAGAPEPLSVRGVQDRVTGNKDAVRAALARLVDEGFVSVETGARNAQNHRLVKPFTEGAP